MTTTHRASALVPNRRGRSGDDPIFALHAEATRRRAAGERVVNATLGALLDEDGSLLVLPTAARAVREVGVDDHAAYAPIAGTPAFLDAVRRDVLGAAAGEAAAVATPGGSGALRHAIATFLEPGQSLLTGSWFWGPYRTLADENERGLVTFRLFTDELAFDVDALDEALGSVIGRQGRALLILNDPCHNPTGYSMSPAEWTAVADVVRKHAAAAPVAVVLDNAYSAYGPAAGMAAALDALRGLADIAPVMVAWSASKTFTHYGLRVGALVVLEHDEGERREIQAALTHACRGTWSNVNRGGLVAITRLLVDPTLRAAVDAERAQAVALLGRRVAAFNDAAREVGLRWPRYDGGFFTTVFAADAQGAAARLRERGVYVVPLPGGLRLGICALSVAEVQPTVVALAESLTT